MITPVRLPRTALRGAAEWFTHLILPRPVPIPWGPTLRAALAMAMALVTGLLIELPQAAIPLAVGSLYASANDTERAYRDRTRHIAWPAFGGAAGITVGSHLRDAVPTVALVTTVGVALIAGMISAKGPTASAAGLQILVMTALGQGLPGHTAPWWQPAIFFLCGAAPVLLLALAPSVRGWHRPVHRTLARAYAAQADLLRAVGTPRAASARRAATDALDAVERSLPGATHAVRGPAGAADPACPRCRPAALLDDLLTASEAAAALAGSQEAVPGPFAAAASDIARRLRSSGHRRGMGRRSGRATSHDLHHLAGDSPLLGRLASAYTTADHRLRVGATHRRHMRRPARDRKPTGRLLWFRAARAARLRRVALTYGLRVALCAGLATPAAELLHPDRGYWLLLTVALVVKPDAGSVLVRGMHRTLGTVVGILLAALLLSLVHDRLGLAVAAVTATALVPLSAALSYGMLTTVVAPVVFVLLHMSGVPAAHLMGERLIDTLAGVGICVVAGHLPWTSSSRRSDRDWVNHAAHTLTAYLDHLLRLGPSAERHTARRAAYRTLAEARRRLAVRHGEPARARARRQAGNLLQVVHLLEHIADVSTAHGLRPAERRAPVTHRSSPKDRTGPAP
ncbi:FUSC family protein [Streptomyces sp. NPDC001508]|uniref:FUSC family protein n=1 Tax=Streptomyces sp. NPDC001508 TaxID=3154656 RepID=UPI00331EFBD3